MAMCAMAAPSASAAAVEVPFTTCPAFGTVPVTSTEGTPTCVQDTCAAIMATSTGSAAACTEPQQTTLVDDVPTYTVAATGGVLRFSEPAEDLGGVNWTQVFLGIGMGALLLAGLTWVLGHAPISGSSRSGEADRATVPVSARLTTQ